MCAVLKHMDLPNFPVDLSPNDPDAQAVLAGEQALLSPQVRGDINALTSLLHEEFSEIGSSGRVYDRSSIIKLLLGEPVDQSPKNLVQNPLFTRLSQNVIMLRWQSVAGRASERTSIWVKTTERWCLYFHQGTGSHISKPNENRNCIKAQNTVKQTLVDPSIALRTPRAEDAPDVLAAFASNSDMDRQGEVRSLEDAQVFITNLLKDSAKIIPLAVTKSGRLVGLVAASLDLGNKNAWVWYWMHADHRGGGLVTRAVCSLADDLFQTHGMQRLELGLRVNNPGSKKVAESSGFLQEGVERGKFLIEGQRVDVLTYSRLASDPRPETSGLPIVHLG